MLLFTVAYVFSLRQSNYAIVDLCWPLSFLIIYIFNFFMYGSLEFSILGLIVTLWSLRLHIYLLRRYKLKSRDWRYEKLKADWGEKHRLHAFFKIFILQGILAFIIALPLINFTHQQNTYGTIIGLSIFAFGFIMESYADYRISLIVKQKKAGALSKDYFISHGLWSYSRHPNYLGEILVWIGIFIYTIHPSTWLLNVLSPLLITFLLHTFSGVPFQTKRFSSKPGYNEYVENTGAIFPFKF